MTRNERQLKAVEQEMERYSQEAQTIWKKADEEDRETTNEERGEVEKHLKAIDDLKVQKSDLEDSIRVEERVKGIGQKIGATESVVPSDDLKAISFPRQTKSIGEMFVESAQFKSVQEQGGSTFSTGAVEIDTKGTLLTGTSAPGSGSGGGLLTVPQVAPGVVEKLFQRTTVPDIIPTGTTNTNTIRYVVEGTATSGAAGVAEGGTKPESTLGLSTIDEPVKKIATTLVVSDEMLEDAAQVQSYINSRLSLFVEIEEEREVVLGGGTNELVGITGRSGVNTYGRGTVDNNAVALFKAINGTRGSSLLETDYIIMNPANWQSTRLLQDANNQFYGGGPFTGAYGQNGIHGNIESGQLSNPYDSIWGKPVIVTTAIGSGTALLGAFGAASMIYRKSGVTIEATNSHASHFTANLVAIRAEKRLALCVFRPAAFTLVSGLT